VGVVTFFSQPIVACAESDRQTDRQTHRYTNKLLPTIPL